MQQADHRSFSLHSVLCCGILNYRKFSSLRAAMVLRHVSSNRCVAVCIYIFLRVEVVYGFHSVLGFFHFLTRRTRLPPRCLRREQKNHDRATKSSPPGAQRQSKDDRSIEKMLLSSFLYRRMRICKFQHAAGVCPNNAPAKPTRPHHRKLVPDPLAMDPVYVWAYHPLIVRL